MIARPEIRVTKDTMNSIVGRCISELAWHESPEYSMDDDDYGWEFYDYIMEAMYGPGFWGYVNGLDNHD